MVKSRPSSQSATPFEFDWQQLKQLAGEDAAFEAELLEMFLSDAKCSLEKLTQAIANDDIQVVEDIAHSLRGASANVGASALAAAACQLETSARSGQLTEAQGLLGVIHDHCEKIQTHFQSHR